MRLVVIESPYAGYVEANTRYLRACMRDCLLRGEAPYASHGLFRAGFSWRQVADATIVYTDLGVSTGMQYGIDDAIMRGVPLEYRALGSWS